MQSLIFRLKLSDSLIAAIHDHRLRLCSDQIIAVPHQSRTLVALVTMYHAIEAILRWAVELLSCITRLATVPCVLSTDCTTLGRRLIIFSVNCVCRVVGGLVKWNALPHLHLTNCIFEHRHFLLEALSLESELCIVALKSEFVLAGHAWIHATYRSTIFVVISFHFYTFIHYNSGAYRHSLDCEEQSWVWLVIVEHWRTDAGANGCLAIATEAFREETRKLTVTEGNVIHWLLRG